MSTVIVSKNSLKKKFLRIFFCLEIVIFSFLYLFGMQGIKAMRQLEHDNAGLDVELKLAQKQARELEVEIAAWKADPFYQEKLAREHLHMARQNEIIFYTKI